MPELPEIKAHAERLDISFRGSVVSDFRALHLSALKTFSPQPAAAVGLAVDKIRHRGKHLLIGLAAQPQLTFVVHLMQGGRLRDDAKKSRHPRGGMARWDFDDGRALLLTEAGTEHRAGVWITEGDPVLAQPLLNLGPDADSLSREELSGILAAHSERLHGLLRNQRRIAGLGRLLANEVAHAARISPFAITSRLTDEEVDRLHTAIMAMIDRGLAHERTLDDLGKSADRPSSVHHRIGEPCSICSDTIRSVEYRRYTVAYCPTCQTNGRKLADNTTSKFLK